MYSLPRRAYAHSTVEFLFCQEKKLTYRLFVAILMAWITHSPVTPPHKHRCLLKKGTTHVWFTPFQRKNSVCSKLCSSFAP